VTESAGRRQRRGRNVFQSILGVGAAVLLAAFLLRPQSSNAGAPGRVTARAFADPSDVAGTGSSSRVHVTFNVASSIPQQNVQQILVYRNTATSPAEVPTFRERARCLSRFCRPVRAIILTTRS
jgi:hypothetical protein